MFESGQSSVICDRNEQQDTMLSLPLIGCYMVFDGMGGHPFGRLAGLTARDAMAFALEAGSHLFGAAVAASEAVADMVPAHQRPHFPRRPGTTVVAFDKPNGTVVWCGDSLAYLFRDGELKLINEPHDLITMHNRKGGYQLPPTGFNSIIRYLGAVGQVGRPEWVAVDLQPGDRVLLCSDGLNPCLLYTSPSPRDGLLSRMPSSA